MFAHEKNLQCSGPLDMLLLVHALVPRILHCSASRYCAGASKIHKGRAITVNREAA